MSPLLLSPEALWRQEYDDAHATVLSAETQFREATGPWADIAAQQLLVARERRRAALAGLRLLSHSALNSPTTTAPKKGCDSHE